ncbi:MAG TPA: DUF3618 domain-containing protein [Pseudolabrys sp.]|jgi:hypothetical protein
MATSAQLERKADRARERLSGRINDLRYHVSPSTVVSDLLGGVNPRAWGEDVLPILAKQARNNPIASMLIAAGVGWLIFSEVRGPISKSLGLKSLSLMSTGQTAKRGKKKRTARNSKAASGSRSK